MAILVALLIIDAGIQPLDDGRPRKADDRRAA